MAQQNPETKHADPYKEANLDTDVSLEQKIRDLSAFMTHCKFAMMTTRDAASGRLVSRCMALAAQETGGIDLLFHTNTESGKTGDLAGDSHTNISFLTHAGEWSVKPKLIFADYSFGASVSGTASVITDRSLVKKYYSPHLRAWLGDLGDSVHDGSENDPRLAIIRVSMATAHYAISHKTIIGHVAEIAHGVVTGKPAVVNKLREISEEEVKQWRSSH